jgi:hypothetical protein
MTVVRNIERTQRMLRNPALEALNSSFMIEMGATENLLRSATEAERIFRRANEVAESIRRASEAGESVRRASEAADYFRRDAERAASQAAAMLGRMPETVRLMKYASVNGLGVRPAPIPAFPAPTPMSTPTPAPAELVDAPDAVVTASEAPETFDWTSRYREALSKPELTDEEKKVLVIHLLVFVTLWVFVLEHQYPAVGNEVARIDATVGVGMITVGILCALLIKRK